MDHRERVLAAVNHQEPDRLPTALWGSAYDITDPLYRELLQYLSVGQPVLPFRTRRGHTVNYQDDRVLEALDTDVRYVWLGFTDLGGRPAGSGLDAWGVGWEQKGIQLTAMQLSLEGTKVGTIWIDYFLRTGLGVFTAAGRKGYVSEKAEGEVEKIVSGEQSRCSL